MSLLASVFESPSTSSQPDVEDAIAAHFWIPALYLSLMFGVSRTFRKKILSHVFILILAMTTMDHFLFVFQTPFANLR